MRRDSANRDPGSAAQREERCTASGARQSLSASMAREQHVAYQPLGHFMFNRLRHLLAPPELKASRTARLVAFENGGRARWTPRDYTGLAREGYLANAIVHRSVRLIAENAAACQFLVFEGAAERDAHPLVQLLTRPNPRQDGGVFFEMLYAHLLLAGNAYIEAVDRVSNAAF